MKTNILKAASVKAGALSQKVSPEVYIGAGIGLMICGTVYACKATLKAGEVIAEKNNNLEMIHNVKNAVESEEPEFANYTEETYSKEDYKKDLVRTYFAEAIGFAKLYGPAALMTIIGIGSILHGHNVLNKTNIAIVAAYEGLKEGYSEYRSRVVKELGEEADRRFKYGIEKKDIEVIEEDENGEVKKTKVKQAETIDGYSKHAKFFDESSMYWEKSPEYNLMFLKEREAIANQMLQQRGHVFFNDIYDLLGMPRTVAGAVEGYLKQKPGEPTKIIDFGIYNLYSEAARNFVNGYENVILLDFKDHDGIIVDHI